MQKPLAENHDLAFVAPSVNMLNWLKRRLHKRITGRQHQPSQFPPEFGPHDSHCGLFIRPLGVIPTRDGKAASVELRNGFRISPVEGRRFAVQIDVSLSVDQIESFVKTFSDQILPDVCYGILEWSEIARNGESKEHIYLTTHKPKCEVLTGLAPYWWRLLNDGFVGFGLAFNGEQYFEEVFVLSKKEIRILTNRPELAQAILLSHGISPRDKPKFISEYPTLNTDLRSLAEFSPVWRAHLVEAIGGEYLIDELSPSRYVPALVRDMSFREDLLAK